MLRAPREQGSALVEVVWLGVLLVPLLWIALGVTNAARAARRAYSLARSDAEGARRARAAAWQVLADQGLADTVAIDPGCKRVTVRPRAPSTCPWPSPARPSGLR